MALFLAQQIATRRQHYSLNLSSKHWLLAAFISAISAGETCSIVAACAHHLSPVHRTNQPSRYLQSTHNFGLPLSVTSSNSRAPLPARPRLLHAQVTIAVTTTGIQESGSFKPSLRLTEVTWFYRLLLCRIPVLKMPS